MLNNNPVQLKLYDVIKKCYCNKFNKKEKMVKTGRKLILSTMNIILTLNIKVEIRVSDYI